MVSFKKDGKLRLGGETLDADSIMGNANFFKTVEGFMESLPQSTYQLSIMMRTPWHEISKNKTQIEFFKLRNCIKKLSSEFAKIKSYAIHKFMIQLKLFK